MTTSSFFIQGSTIPNDPVDAVVADSQREPSHSGLIALLAAAQKYHVDIIRTTYQRARKDLGRGGEANIRQAFVQQNLGLAFRDLRAFSDRGDVETDTPQISQAYNAMITELTILSQPLIRKSRHVINLGGISRTQVIIRREVIINSVLSQWNVDADTYTVWPVFAYEEGIPLSKYLSATRKTPLSLEDKLDLCLGICSGVAAIHDAGAVHADLKPDNIIVRKDPALREATDSKENAIYAIPKIIDLSLSIIGEDADLKRLPRTRGWTAPEWHEREFQICKARLMDVFSLGLIIYWVLAPGQKSSQPAKENDAEAMPQLDGHDTDITLETALETLQEMELDAALHSRLEQLFNHTLAPDPGRRATHAGALLSLLGGSYESVQNELRGCTQDVATDRCSFHIGKSIAQLSMADFRVRKAVFRELAAPTCSTCASCMRNNALQAAICYEIAFGTDRSAEQAEELLQIASCDRSRLLLEIEALRVPYEPNGPDELPHFLELDLVHEYQRRRDVLKACSHLKREISGRQLWFVDGHPLVVVLRAELALILDETGRHRDAQAMQKEVLQAYRAMSGEGHHNTIASLAQLSSFHTNFGRNQEAVETGEEAVALCKRYHLAMNDRTAMATTANLANAYFHAGRFEEAEKLQIEVVRSHEEILGFEHSDTLRCLSNQASFLLQQPTARPEAAIGILRRVRQAREEYQGLEHRDTLHAQASLLACVLKMSGPTEDLLDSKKELYEQAKTFLGLGDPDTWIYAANLASTMSMLGSSGSASELFRESQSRLEQILGPTHRETLNVVLLRAQQYQYHGSYAEADALFQQITERDMEFTGEVSDVLLRAMCLLGESHAKQGRPQQAREKWEEAVALSEERWSTGLAHDMTRPVMTELADMHFHEGNLERYFEINQSLAQWAVDHGQQNGREGLRYEANVALFYLTRGEIEEASARLLDLRDRCLLHLDPNDEVTISVMRTLITTWNRQGRHNEAIMAARGLLSSLQQTLGPAHEDTLLLMNNLSMFLVAIDSFDEAETLMLELMNLCIQQDNTSLACVAMHNLASLYDDQEKLHDAIKLQRELVAKHATLSDSLSADSAQELYYLAFYLSNDPGKLTKALETSKGAWDFLDGYLGYKHDDTIKCAGLLGWILQELGEFEEAKTFFERELKGATELTRDDKEDWIKGAKDHLHGLEEKRRGLEGSR